MSKFNLRLPWLQPASPEQAAGREEAKRRQADVARLAESNRQAEMQRQSADLRELARGGIPIQAVERLKEIGDSDSAIFTSDLTPEEMALLRREGYRALGMVSGSAMYHVGQAYASATNDCEVKVLSEAYDAAMALAVNRMKQELQHIGAHGVIGVRLSLVRHEWADKTIEAQVIGTAVEPLRPPPNPQNWGNQAGSEPPAEPWMCDLSGQEWWALHRAGYQPVGLVWGHAAWFVLNTYYDEQLVRSWQNVELTHWSQALSQARHIALNSVMHQTKKVGGTGVAGVKVDRRLDEVRLTGGEGDVYEREHHNLVVAVVGTAIRPIPHAPTAVKATRTVLSLRDGRLAPVQIGAGDADIE